VDEVHAHLRAVGRDGHEGLGLWAGTQESDQFTVRQAIIPVQKHIRTRDGVCVAIGPDELHRLNVRLYKEKLVLIAQIHSHPGRAYHSSTDDEFAVATAVGCLSLVVPDYAVAPFDLRKVASYRLDARGRWCEIRPSETTRLIRIVD
jgi:proteasome lid subunit RPN8/RPN11